jgi:hypothetical protein
MGQIIRDWYNNEIGIIPAKGENPMLRHGYGPSGALCKDCVHLLRNEHHNQTYFKCELYKLSHGGASDFRARWPACKKFEAGEQKTIFTE